MQLSQTASRLRRGLRLAVFAVVSILLTRSLFLLAMEAWPCNTNVPSASDYNATFCRRCTSQAMLLRLCPWNIKA